MSELASVRDVVGKTVVDVHGLEIGEVDQLTVDDREHRVRFVRVTCGGILGIGGTKFLIPIDAIKSVSDEEIELERELDDVAAAPPYEPGCGEDEHYLNRLYSYYGYAPLWQAGHAYPSYTRV